MPPKAKTKSPQTDTPILRQSAEQKYADELLRLKENDKAPKPTGWELSAHAVRKFILGDKALDITQKFYGDDALVDRSLVTLMGKQGLMLVGEPGTAKSMLSELFSAGISGNSNHTVQGSAGTTEDHIKYSWNYALLLSQGPTEQALIASPIYHAMKHGKIARFEEITRCPAEIQDVMISLLSEKRMMIGEMGQDYALEAKAGFNVIATANLRDRGVHDMSSALKRRFNFETVKAIKDKNFEIELINAQLKNELKDLYKEVKIHQSVIDILVTVFNELRTGQSQDGGHLKVPDAVMSSAEAVNVAHNACLQAIYLGNGELTARHIGEQITGVVFKDNKDDAKKMSYYLDTVIKERGKKDKEWQEFYQGSKNFD